MPTPSELYREIPLTKGFVAIVDAADYSWLSCLKWHAHITYCAVYAVAAVRHSDGQYRNVYMHRLIMGLKRGDRRKVDHIEPSETLNNTRGNLRVCSHMQNQANRRSNKNNTSGFKGVTKSPTKGKWLAAITLSYKNVHLGTFSSPEAAHEAYCKAAQEHNGEFARFG